VQKKEQEDVSVRMHTKCTHTGKHTGTHRHTQAHTLCFAISASLACTSALVLACLACLACSILAFLVLAIVQLILGFSSRLEFQSRGDQSRGAIFINFKFTKMFLHTSLNKDARASSYADVCQCMQTLGYIADRYIADILKYIGPRAGL
jgi:heme/copper-type cytochrome/quinol oxidase subunit 4